MRNRITKLTERYLEHLLTLLDQGEEVPMGMTIKEYVGANGVITLTDVYLACDCVREIVRQPKLRLVSNEQTI